MMAMTVNNDVEAKKDSKRKYRKAAFEAPNVKDFTLQYEELMMYAVSSTITITDTRNPEIAPIHRHTMVGIASSTSQGEAMLRAAIGNAGFKTSDYSTRLGTSEMKVIYTKREHTQGLVEDFEWTCQLFEVDKHDRD